MSNYFACSIFAIIAGFTAAPSVANTPWVPEKDTVLEFEVLRKGKPFGVHRVTFDVGSDALVVQSDVDLEVKVGPFTAFNYAHENIETWVDGGLVSLSSSTRKDGNDYEVDVQKTDEGLAVKGTTYQGLVSYEAIPSSHWNINQLSNGQLLSTETGELLPVTVETLGVEQIEAAGETIKATRYRLYSDLEVDLWYDENNRWVKCSFEARGQKIEYVLR